MKWYSQAELDYAIAVARMQWYNLGRWHSQDIKDATLEIPFNMPLVTANNCLVASIHSELWRNGNAQRSWVYLRYTMQGDYTNNGWRHELATEKFSSNLANYTHYEI